MVQIKLTTVSPWCIFRSADFVVLYWYCTTFSILIRLTNSLVYVLPHWLCCTIYWLVYWLDWLMMYGMFHLTDCVVLYWYCTSVLKRLTNSLVYVPPHWLCCTLQDVPDTTAVGTGAHAPWLQALPPRPPTAVPGRQTTAALPEPKGWLE